jgi:heterodisulfide reductase subunit B
MSNTYSYYPGCTSHSTAAEYIEASQEVMSTLGIELRELPDWCCCGAASAHNLSKTLALGLSSFNILEAQKAEDDLLIPCAGCYNSLARANHVLQTNSQERARLEKILDFSYSGKIRILSIVDLLARDEMREEIRKRVAKPLHGLKLVCYYGCLLVRPAAITGADDPENPMRLDDLMTDLGAEVIHWSCKVDCCGADMGMSHGRKARALVERITDYAIAAGAHCMVTSCGLCQMNVDSRQNRMPILYFTELIAEALQIGNRRRWWKKHINNPTAVLQGMP